MSSNRLLQQACAFAALFVCALPAVAQSPNFDWAGPYLGVQGGFDQSEFDATGTLSLKSGRHTYSASTTQSYGSGQVGDISPYVGYNFQAKNGIVLGGEADFHWADLSADSDPLLQIGLCPTIACANLGGVHSSLDWYGTVRGTIGQSIGRMLIFGTGGFAYGDVSSTVSSDLTIFGHSHPLGSTSDSGMRYGWTAGGGMALAINEKVSLRALFLHTDLGEKTIARTSTNILGSTVSSEVKDAIRFDSILVGLTVRFP
jgi:outer membrane immunogenic protein